MSLEQWRSNGWLKSHRTDATELLAFAKDLREEVVGLLAEKYPGLGRQKA